MFAIHKIQITDKQQYVLNVDLSEAECKKLWSRNYTTLVLGENGVGKSFLLKSIIDIFLFLENASDTNRKRKPRFQYESFYVEYSLGNDTYTIHRISGSQIVATKNGEKIDYKDVSLPTKILAISFMVNDKFQYTKDEDIGMYTYHGVRTSTNSTYTSSIARNIIFDLIHCLKKGLIAQVKEIFAILQFDSLIEFEWNFDKKFKNQTVNLDNDELHVVFNYRIDKYVYPTVYFFKDGKKLTFDLCSSGEKHILFAYLGILSRISDNALILIDEPEISLHPEWQIRYVSTLTKLFVKYQNCCFILASHSHYFVSELKSESSSIVVLRKTLNDDYPKAEIIPYDTYSWSAENIIYNVFGIRTTRNFYFEGDLSSLLNSLEAFDDSEQQRAAIQRQINKLRKYVFNENDPLFLILSEAEERIK